MRGMILSGGMDQVDVYSERHMPHRQVSAEVANVVSQGRITNCASYFHPETWSQHAHHLSAEVESAAAQTMNDL